MKNNLRYKTLLETTDGAVKVTGVFVVYGHAIPELVTCVDPERCTEDEWDRLLEFLMEEIIDNGIYDMYKEAITTYYGKEGDYHVDIGFELMGEVKTIEPPDYC